MKNKIKEENLSHHRVIYEQGRTQAFEKELEFRKDVNVVLNNKTLERLHKEDNHGISIKECGYENCIFKRIQNGLKEIAQIKKEIKE